MLTALRAQVHETLSKTSIYALLFTWVQTVQQRTRLRRLMGLKCSQPVTWCDVEPGFPADGKPLIAPPPTAKSVYISLCRWQEAGADELGPPLIHHFKNGDSVELRRDQPDAFRKLDPILIGEVFGSSWKEIKLLVNELYLPLLQRPDTLSMLAQPCRIDMLRPKVRIHVSAGCASRASLLIEGSSRRRTRGCGGGAFQLSEGASGCCRRTS